MLSSTLLTAASLSLLLAGCGSVLSPLQPSPETSAAAAGAGCPPPSRPAGLISDFEDQAAFNYQGGTNTRVPVGASSSGNALYARYESGSSLAGGTACSSLYLSGQVIYNSKVSYVFNFPDSFDIGAAAPQGRLMLSAQMLAASAATEIWIRLVHPTNPQDWSVYEYRIFPGSSWSATAMYIPYRGTGPLITNSYGVCTGWTSGNEFAKPCWGTFAPRADWGTKKALITGISIDILGPTSSSAPPRRFDFKLDDFYFE